MRRETTDVRPPASHQPDLNDQARLRHARDRHLGFPVGRYLQSPPMLFSRDGHNLFLGDFYRGRPAFLICSGPSLKDHDLGLLHQPGFLTLALNNAAVLFRPQLWTSVDDPGNFCDAIWRDPGILKFVPLCHMEKHFLVRDPQDQLVPSEECVGDMPAVFGFRRNEAFVAEQWLYEDTFNWGNHGDRIDAHGNKGSRSVFYVALRLLFYLGVRRVYLLGCDFRMENGKDNYAFPQDRTAASVRNNNESYRILNGRLHHLKPYFDREGFEVFNCTPNSGLSVFPQLPYEEAVAQVRAHLPGKINTAGMYDFKRRQQESEKAGAEAAAEKAAAASTFLPAMTLLLTLDAAGAQKLRLTWPGWMRGQPWLNDVPVVVVHDRSLGPQDLTWLGDGARFRWVAHEARDLSEERPQRLPAVTAGVAEHVQTPWYFLLDAGAWAGGQAPAAAPEWFVPDNTGRSSAFVAHAWGYTKPADAIARLDAWGDAVEGLSSHSRLNLPFQADEGLVRHPTVRGWCLFGNTAWTREVAAYAAAGPPPTSLATFFAYCAARRGDRVVRVNMKQRGWEPVRRLDELRARSEAGLTA